MGLEFGHEVGGAGGKGQEGVVEQAGVSGIHDGAGGRVDGERGDQGGNIFYGSAVEGKKVCRGSGVGNGSKVGRGGTKRRKRIVTVIYSIKSS